MIKVFLNILILLFLNSLGFAQYQNHSGLKNKRLRLVNIDNRQTFDAVQGGLPSDESLPTWPPRSVQKANTGASVDSVVVLDDAPQHLILLVYFSGINKASIQAVATSDKSKIVPSFNAGAIPITDGQSPVEITLKAKLPENVEILSKQLSLEIVESVRAAPNKNYTFGLNKKWTTQIKAENLNQLVALEPVGKAASLWQMSKNDPLPETDFKASPNSQENLAKLSGTPKINDKNPKGPSKLAFSLWDNIRTDVDFELSDISNIKTEIHPDINPASETFYILPVSYNLKWTEEEGYKNFKIIYGVNNEVQFHVGLSSGITTKQIETIRYLIKRLYKSQNLEIQNPKIQLLGANSTPTISLRGDFQGAFQIDPNKVTISPVTDFTSPLSISFSTDNKTKDMIVVALQNGIGLNGSMTIGADSIQSQIPLSIAFNDKRNYGKLILTKENWRNNEWQNKFPYPIKIRYLHALLENPTAQNGTTNHIYSWSCNNTLAPPGSRVGFNSTKIPSWFDTSERVVQLWLEYDVEVCATCTQGIFNGLTKGLSGSSETNLTFQSMDLLSAYGATLVQIRVKSLQGDPSKNKEVEYSKNITKDGEEISIGPFYTGSDKQISYQYKVMVVNNQAPIETNWISDTNPQQYLNKAGLEKLNGKTSKY
jgi:hypothetical protein